MRDINDFKFRGYDTEYEKMTYFDDEDYLLSCGQILRSKIEWNYDYDEERIGYEDVNNKIILMQYTGLHDKNGKEIYEGDIVKAYFKKGAWKYNDKNYFGYKSGKVQYCVDGFILYIENYKEKIYPLSSFGNNNGNINELEVIGNIYDNLELLGGE